MIYVEHAQSSGGVWQQLRRRVVRHVLHTMVFLGGQIPPPALTVSCDMAAGIERCGYPSSSSRIVQAQMSKCQA
jgi:hypothetical protein